MNHSAGHASRLFSFGLELAMTARDEAPQWRTSVRSSGGSCVEIQTRPEAVLVRDSKNRDGGMLAFDRASFADFLGGIKDGEFDLG